MKNFPKTQLAIALALAAGLTAGCNNNPERASTGDRDNAEIVSTANSSNTGANTDARSADIENRQVGANPARSNEYSMQEDYPSLENDENQYSRNQAQQTGSLDEKNTLLFEFDSAELTDEAKESLDRLVEALEGQDDTVEGITIRGYADARGSESYNEQLSQSRANNVRNYLRDRGINADSWSVEGLGEENPVASNDDAQGRRENRRVVIELTGDNVRGLTSSYSPD